MSVLRVDIHLTGWRPNGDSVSPDEFVTLLGFPLDEYPRYGVPERWRAVGFEIGALSLRTFAVADAPHDGIHAATQDILRSLAACLARAPSDAGERLRSAGIQTKVIVNLEIDSDQFDLEVPPELSLQLGRLGFGIHLLSNE